MKTNDIRQAFLKYFETYGHTIVPSSSLVPNNDPTLLFTNAGMVQFKDVFLGLDKRPYTRATTSQRCVRAGGKHNDLDNVGYTARHHTFFEMLGNFSFGDYFKEQAITYAWDFLTEVLKLPKEKLWITVHKDDQEAADIWLKQIKVDPNKFSYCGDDDNFWAMGDTGPCGPCSEIFYDHGPAVEGGPPGSPDQDGDRYIEIWNLVFMQYERSSTGELSELPKPSVDTGMGLERLAAVLQGVHNNYEIDSFHQIIKAIAKITKTDDLSHTSLRVIADHIRSTAFLICDGVTPSNEGRGYVLRRIIRRAIRHGHQLGVRDAFFHQLVKPLVKEMGEAYPELTKGKSNIEKVLKQEEAQFAITLEQGLKIFEQTIKACDDKVIPGKEVFKLYDTYGFPADLTADIARERGLTIDEDGFEHEMAKQRAKSQQASQFTMDLPDNIAGLPQTDFSGYELLGHDAKVTHLFQNGKPVDSLKKEDEGAVVLNKTPFYAESGGQVGDSGVFRLAKGDFIVHDTKKQGQVFLHYGKLQGPSLKVNDQVEAAVDIDRRRAIMLNHSATHLLHAALRFVLGEHVMQKGSLVEADRLRFDFTHSEPVTASQLLSLENLVNQKIRENIPSTIEEMSPKDAQKTGALALFGEKYGEKVRVLSMGDFSKELCGGTHVERSGDIGLFKITSEAGIASGVRRIEAITGDKALMWMNETTTTLAEASALLKTKPDKLLSKLTQALEEKRQLEKSIKQLQGKMATSQSGDLAEQAKEINSIKVLAKEIPQASAETLRDTLDHLKNKLKSGVIVLASVDQTKVSLVAGVTKDCTTKFHAGDLIKHVATQVGGKGGGRADMAQAGGNQPENLNKALESVYHWVETKA